MKAYCSHCGEEFEAAADQGSLGVECPRCTQLIRAESTPPIMNDSRGWIANPGLLRDPREGTAFICLACFSVIGWILFLLWTLATVGTILLFIGLFLLVRYMVSLFAAAYIKTNAVEVSRLQFPEIHQIVTDFSRKLGKQPPTVYVMQSSIWNAMAMRLAGRRMVMLLSGAIDSLLLKGSMEQVAWVVGHELGHHFADHLNYMRRLTVFMGSWCIWFKLWYQRRCELTCDKYGLACTDSLQHSLLAACNMTVGAQLADALNIQQAIHQWEKHRSEFFVRYRTIYSTHPHHLWRMQAMTEAAGQLGIPA